MFELIDGKAFSHKLIQELEPHISKITEQTGKPPALAVVLVGEDAASQVYVRNKAKQTKAAGMISVEHRLSAGTDQDTLLNLIHNLNQDDDIDGILVQLPLPRHIDEHAVIQSIDPEKDVDGFHEINVGKLATGQPALVPCTPLGCLLLLRDKLGDLRGLNAVIIGRSNIVGKPLANLLLADNATVTITHSHTRDLPAIARQADILIAAVGRPEMVKSNWVKPGACVIDVGINRLPAPENGEGKFRLTGDVDFQQVKQVAGAITPVPGGVGPMTIGCLLRNTVTAAAQRRGVEIGLN